MTPTMTEPSGRMKRALFLLFTIVLTPGGCVPWQLALFDIVLLNVSVWLLFKGERHE